MNVSPRSKFLLLGILLFLLLGGVFVVYQTKLIWRLYDYMVNNKNHYLPCDKLPTLTDVTNVVDGHKDVIEQIEQIRPDYTSVMVDSFSCPGKADIVIWYPSHEDRTKIEQLLGDDETFFGIPLRLRNY